MSARAASLAVLVMVSAFSAFPSPFYGDIASASPLGLWASAVLFSVHGMAVIVAMTLVRGGGAVAALGTRRLLVVALIVDVAGGLALAAGMAASSFSALAAGRIVTGLALGLATPLLTEALSRARRGTALATAGTLGGVGLGALAAAVLAWAGASVPAVFIAGSAALAVSIAAVMASPAPPAPASAPVAAVAAGVDLGAAVAVVVVFAANGVLGLFTSLIPALAAPMLGGGALLAGVVVASTMIGAGAARLAVRPSSPRAVAAAAMLATVLGAAVFSVALAARMDALAVAGALLLGAACGLGYDEGLRMAIGSRVDALRRVASVARVQRAGQLGLVLPALIFPVLIQA